jgi:hypothetical protein
MIPVIQGHYLELVVSQLIAVVHKLRGLTGGLISIGLLTGRPRIRFLFSHFNLLQPSAHYMYRQFNIQQFYALPTQCNCVFCVHLRTNSDYFTTLH